MRTEGFRPGGQDTECSLSSRKGKPPFVLIMATLETQSESRVEGRGISRDHQELRDMWNLLSHGLLVTQA